MTFIIFWIKEFPMIIDRFLVVNEGFIQNLILLGLPTLTAQSRWENDSLISCNTGKQKIISSCLLEYH